MKLIGALIVHNELGRYLRPCLTHLLSYCDELRILDDGSTDDWQARLSGLLTAGELARLRVLRSDEASMFVHEGRARQRLLEWTLEGEPTHVLAIDADEFVSHPGLVRGACEDPGSAWTLSMEEVWRAEEDCLCVRMDGGWRPHPVPILYRVPVHASRDPRFRIEDKALACGREPIVIRLRRSISRPTGASVLHFGWANPSERVARHHRYAVADAGRYHASAHLDSILWPDGDPRLALEGLDWPSGLDRAALLAAATLPR